MKKGALIITMLIVLTGQTSGQLQNLIRQTEKAVFAIYTYDEYGVATGIGTGFFISADGIALSNYHVLEGASMGVIKMVDGKTFEVSQIISSSEQADLIRFKVDTKGETTPFLTTKNSPAEKGEKIFVIGNPHGFESSVSEGIISSVRPSNDYSSIIQITAPISPGSSGSPVMTMDGKVIGIATFQFAQGQNLSFAVGINAVNSLKVSHGSFGVSQPDVRIINERCLTNSELMLNSIEFLNHETVLNFSFTNVSLGFGTNMLIWISFDDIDDMFFIQDLKTLQKYYANSSTIGTSRENGTPVALGETKRFRVIFPPIPKNISRVNIIEGLSSSWKFLDLDLSKYTNIERQNTENHVKNYALVKLETQRYDEAISLLSESISANKADHDAYTILGIISYIIDKNHDALLYFSKAIEISPNNPIYYFNRFRVHFEHRRDNESALRDISAAIRINPGQGDYYQYRAYVHMDNKDWRKAVSDWDLAINLMGENISYLFVQRGICKTWLDDFSGACRDWSHAYWLSNYQDKELKGWIDEVCR